MNALVYPEIVLLGFTSRCQLQCIMCIEHAKQSWKKGTLGIDISSELLAKCLPVIQKAKVLKIGGIGEPLLYRQLIEHIEHIHTINPKIIIELYTNGLLLDSVPRIENLLRHIDILHISINGITHYEKIMVGAKQARIHSNLDLIQDCRSNLKQKPEVWLDAVIMKRNTEDIIPLTRLAIAHHFTGVIFKDLWISNSSIARESVRQTKVLDNVRQLLHQAIALGKKNNITIVADELLDQSRAKTICDAPWKMVQFAEDGKVLLCCNGYTVVGNLNQNSFEEIWNGKAAHAYRKGLETKRYYRDCKKCKLINLKKSSYIRKR
jgi:radical SAM protein with 4Fe4S-binding SPASM domain